MLWQQLRLPGRLAQGDVDLFWSPLFTLPARCPVPAVATGKWREIFSSDLAEYGGTKVTNEGELEASGGQLTVKLAARSFLVLRHVAQG